VSSDAPARGKEANSGRRSLLVAEPTPATSRPHGHLYATAELEHNRAVAEHRYQEAKRRAEEEHLQEVRARSRQRNGQDGPMADAVTDLMRSIDGGRA
jgi:hypothetical protein